MPRCPKCNKPKPIELNGHKLVQCCATVYQVTSRAAFEAKKKHGYTSIIDGVPYMLSLRQVGTSLVPVVIIEEEQFYE